jgi:ABC-type polysaccharide/polyol phosphate export permease
MLLRTFVYLFIFILFAKAFATEEQLKFLIVSGIATNFITNLVIGANFEIANDVKTNTYVNIKMSPVSIYTYFFSQALFQGMIFSGTLYPISIFPKSIQYICMLSPFTHGLDLVRSILLGSKTLILFNVELIILLVSSLVMIVVSKFLVSWYFRRVDI